MMNRWSMLCALLLFPVSALLAGPTLTVNNDVELRTALQNIQPGTVLKIGPGDYAAGHHVAGVEKLTIEALNPEKPPVFRGGKTGWQFSRCPGLTLRHIHVTGQTQNGLNLDDGGDLENHVLGITLEHVQVSDIGPTGNFDGIKCSGLTGLTIRDCTLSGWGGQGIDFVGCHQSQIIGCHFIGKPGFSASAGIQLKGGTSEIVVEKCHFKDAGARPLNIGGSTGLAYFRPPQTKHEAKAIVVRDNVIEGSPCSAAFVGVDGAEFSGNTLRFPEKWIFRILQETREPGFPPCRNVVVKNNTILFRRAQVQTEINIGSDTAPETFLFEGNHWHAEDRPAASKPRLPVEEKDGKYGA